MIKYVILLALACGAMAHADGPNAAPSGDVGSNSPELAQLAQDIKDGKYGSQFKDNSTRDNGTQTISDLSKMPANDPVTIDIDGIQVGHLSACWDVESELATLSTRYAVQYSTEKRKNFFFKNLDVQVTGTVSNVQGFAQSLSNWMTPCMADDGN